MSRVADLRSANNILDGNPEAKNTTTDTMNTNMTQLVS
jgi:hypothetical protein